jgi:uncharacterized GH25 family protein
MNAHHFLSLFLTFLLSTQAITLFAHDTWLLPKAFRVQQERPTVLAMTSAMAFPRPASAIAQDRIAQAMMRLAGETIQLGKFQRSTKTLNITVNPSNVGVAAVSVALKPRTLELTPKLVREYLEEIGASDSLKNVWKNPPSGLKWRETYAKHTKTFLGVGGEKFFQNDSSWSAPQGLQLEIIPERHPCLLRRGQDLPVVVLLNGKPLANFPLGLVRAGEKHGLLQTTDANGRTTFKLPKAAQYLLRGTLLLPSSAPNTEWESHFTTLTVEAR